MTDLNFTIDWDTADSTVKAPELRTTWAQLTMSIGTEPVTLVEDVESGSVRRGIHVALYPLAEWIATNWWRLQYDARRLAPRRSPEQRRMRTADDGFLWPNVSIVPTGRVAEVEWRSDHVARRGSPIRYLSRGTAEVPMGHLADRLAAVVMAVIDRLVEAEIRDTFLQQEWARTTTLTADERRFCESAARLGLDPFQEGVAMASDIGTAYSMVAEAIWDDLLDAVDPQDLLEAAGWVATSRVRLDVLGERGASAGFEDLRRIRDRDDLPPWTRGWDAAKRLRAELDVDDTQTISDLGIHTEVNPRRSTRPVGLARAVDSSVGLVSSRRLSPASKRFHEARALWHVARKSSGDDALLTEARTELQSVGRAFAAELLAPARGLEQVLDGDFSDDSLEDAAMHFAAPLAVVRHQVENQLAA